MICQERVELPRANIRTQVNECTNRKLKAIKELFGLNNIGEAIDTLIIACGDELLASPSLREGVARRMMSEYIEDRVSFKEGGMSKDDILELLGATKYDTTDD